MSLSQKLGLSTVTELQGKRVLIRVDFNVPFADGKISNNQRIVAALPTVEHVLKAGIFTILRPFGVFLILSSIAVLNDSMC